MKEIIGKGGFGNVYKGIQKETGLKVAIKSIKKAKMTEDHLVYHRREIDSLKMC